MCNRIAILILGGMALAFSSNFAQADIVFNYSLTDGSYSPVISGDPGILTGTFTFDATTVQITSAAVQLSGYALPLTDISFQGSQGLNSDYLFRIVNNEGRFGGGLDTLSLLLNGLPVKINPDSIIQIGPDSLPAVQGTFFAATVPEPSTWAMLLIGFAGIGFAGYRKRRQYTFAPTAVM
jgi:hypothetical protein